MEIYNTVERAIGSFNPSKKILKMYTCGPTVYHYAHIGNLRTYIMEDALDLGSSAARHGGSSPFARTN